MRPDHRTHRDPTVRHGDTDSLRTTSRGDLAHLSALDDYKIADGEPDIRGWDVKATDGRKLGEVADLLVDTGAMKVRYVEVKLDDDVADEAARIAGTTDPRTEPTRHRLVPIGAARLDDEHDDVRLDADTTRLLGLPAYRRDGITREYEQRLLQGYGLPEREIDSTGRAASAGEFYAGREFDDGAFFGGRRGGRDDATYITRSGKRRAD